MNIDEQYPEDIELPKTVYGNVRALRYALDHPLTFTQSSGYRNEQLSKYNRRMVSKKTMIIFVIFYLERKRSI